MIMMMILLQGMMHSSSEEEMRDVKQFIAQCLPWSEKTAIVDNCDE